MAQIQTTEIFGDGQLVTGQRLNNIVASATALDGLITEQTWLTQNGLSNGTTLPVENNDRIILYDGSGLKQTTIANLFGSDIAITSSLVEGDNPNFRQTTGTVTIGSPLVNNPSNTPDVLVQGSGSHILLDATGGTKVTNTLEVIGNASVTGSFNADSFGASSFTDNVTLTSTSNLLIQGNANFTGTFKVNNATGWVLTDIIEETIPQIGPLGIGENFIQVWQSNQHVKTTASNEIWVIKFAVSNKKTSPETDAGSQHLSAISWRDELGQVYFVAKQENTGSKAWFYYEAEFVLPTTVSHNGRFVLFNYLNAEAGNEGYVNNMTVSGNNPAWNNAVITSKFTIFKYKTA